MVTTQQYSLRWNNYFRHLTYALDNHRADCDFVDVTLICDGRKIKAHKVVLSSCSAYFKEIFKENPHPHPVIIFKFIKFEDLNSIIEFMYQGEVNVQQEALQSFLQTAELLAVQGLTAEDKEKPKAPTLPIIDEQKLIKTIPSTIRPINETVSATQASTQTIEIPAAALIQTHQHQQQQQQQPQHHHVQTAQIQHIQVQQQHHQPQTIQVQTPQHINQAVTNQTQQQQHQQPQQQQHLQTVQTNTVQLSNPNSMKKRKITFSDDDDNIYTTESVDYAVKDDQSIVKTTEMTFLRGTVKMDIPEYIVSEVDDRLSDGTTPQTSQDDNNTGSQNVTQYTSEYEILTESEIEEKYHQQEAENAEISIEMGRLLNAGGTSATTTNTNQNELDDTQRAQTTAVVKSDNKGNGTDLPSSKWTECQFCKMIITTVNLWRHIRTQHTPQPPRKCELCNKNFKNKYSLREHIRISHEQKVVTKNEN